MKKRAMLLGAALSVVLLLGACSSAGSGAAGSAGSGGDSSAGSGGSHKISAEEAKEMLDQGGATVVDVRTAEEYAEGHIPGAVLVPVDTIGDEPPLALSDKDAVLLVHCRTGVRSKRAANQLVKLGYTQVYDFGGIVDWPYETESGAGSEQ